MSTPLPHSPTPAPSPLPAPLGLGNTTRALLWLLLGCLMIAVPLAMIARKEHTLRAGQTLKFRLAPIDPSDPFRGRYMTLSFDVERGHYAIPPGEESEYSDEGRAFARLGTDAEGFAKVEQILTSSPTDGSPWLTVIVHRRQGRIEMPFKRFYLNEEKAQAVENEAREWLAADRQAGRPGSVHAVVRLHQGEGVVTELRGPKGPLDGVGGPETSAPGTMPAEAPRIPSN